MADEATMLNQAAYDQIAGLYTARQADRGRSFADLRAAFAARLPRVADVADLGCGPAGDGALFAQAGIASPASTGQRGCWPTPLGRSPGA